MSQTTENPSASDATANMHTVQCPVSAHVCYLKDDLQTDTEQFFFKSVSAAYKTLCQFPQDVLALHVDISGPDIPAEDLACLFQLNMNHMTSLYLGADPIADELADIVRPCTTEQWPVEYPSDLAIDPEDYIRTYVRPPFVFAHFLHGLNLWAALERIEIRCFLHLPTADKDHIPPLELSLCDWTLAKHPNLQTLIIEDVPHRVKFLMEYLYVPVNVDVQLIAASTTRTFEADMLKEMLPAYSLGAIGAGMFDEATHVHVRVGRDGMLVCGKLSPDEDDKRRLVFEAQPASGKTLDSHEGRRELLFKLLHDLPTFFDPSGVTDLRINGDVTGIDATKEWLGFLRPFLKLETLRIDDGTDGRYGSISAICEALAHRTVDAWRRPEAPVCPRLIKLHITEIEFSIRCPGGRGSDNLYAALEERKKTGYPISYCVCELKDRPKNKRGPQLQKAARKLSAVVKSAILKDQSGKTYTHRPRPVVRLLLPADSK